MLLLPWLGLHVQAGMKNLRHPQMVLVFFSLFWSWGRFAQLIFPVRVVMPRMQPLPFEEPVLKVQKHLSAKMLANTGWKASDLLCLEKT